MPEFKDYSMMFAAIDGWSKEKLSSELERYRIKAKEIASKKADYDRNATILSKNTQYFEKRLKEIESIDRRKNFVLKKEHLLLLKNLNIDYENGYIFMDTKRPLGYSYQLEGVCRALGLDHNSEDFTREDEKEVWKLVGEMPLAFEHIVNDRLADSYGI